MYIFVCVFNYNPTILLVEPFNTNLRCHGIHFSKIFGTKNSLTLYENNYHYLSVPNPTTSKAICTFLVKMGRDLSTQTIIVKNHFLIYIEVLYYSEGM